MMPIFNRFYRGLGNMRRCWEIRLANPQIDNIRALTSELGRFGKNCKGALCSESFIGRIQSW